MERPDRSPLYDAMKDNAVLIARQHQATCQGQDCGASLFLLGKLVQEAGFELTDAEWEAFGW